MTTEIKRDVFDQKNLKDVYFWSAPDTEPVIGHMTDQEAIMLAVKSTQERFRRKGIGEQDVLDPRLPKTRGAELRTAAKAAHNLLLAVLYNTSVDYPVIADALDGYESSPDKAKQAMLKAQADIRENGDLRTTFDGIQESYRRQFIGRQAVQG